MSYVCGKSTLDPLFQVTMGESSKDELEQFRSWHDEAFLYITQAMTQEKQNIARYDVALLMYQRGLGLLDQALCFDGDAGTSAVPRRSAQCSASPGSWPG